jgi:hypothetical protein
MMAYQSTADTESAPQEYPMNYFTRDNTEGYSCRDLDILNRLLEASLDRVDADWLRDADDDVLDSHVKNLAAECEAEFYATYGRR